MMMRTGLVVILMWSGLALAAPLELSALPADSQWVMHIDASAIRGSKAMTESVNLLRNGPLKEKLQAIETLTSVDLVDGIDSITACGPNVKRDDAIIFLRGKFGVEQLTTMMQHNPSFRTESIGEQEVVSWSHKTLGNNRRIYAAFSGSNCIVLSPGARSITSALDVLSGKTQGLDQGSVLAQTHVPTPLFFFAAANGVRKMEGIRPEAAILKKIDDLSVLVYEEGGTLELSAELGAADEAVATELLKVTEGLVAMAKLSEPTNPALIELANSMRVSVKNKRVQASGRVAVNQIHTRVMHLMRAHEKMVRRAISAGANAGLRR